VRNQKRVDLTPTRAFERDCAFQEDVRQKQKCCAHDKQHVSLPRLIGALSALVNCKETDEAEKVQYKGDNSVRNELATDTWVQEVNLALA